jgi:hypothetical protein
MTTSSCDEPISRPAISPPARVLSDAAAATDHQPLHAKVTYAPLAVWKDFHWTCTVTSFASPLQDRLE